MDSKVVFKHMLSYSESSDILVHYCFPDTYKSINYVILPIVDISFSLVPTNLETYCLYKWLNVWILFY